MPLQPQLFTVNVGSLRTDVDPRSLQPSVTPLDPRMLSPHSGVLELVNCVMTQTGAVVKRNGNVTQPLTFGPAATWQLATYRNSLIALGKVGNTPIARWSPTENVWSLQSDFFSNKGANRGPIITSKMNIAQSGLSATVPDCAISNNYIALTFEQIFSNIGGQTAQLIIDPVTGATIVSMTNAVTGIRPRVLLVNGFFIFICILSSGSISFTKIDATTGNQIGTVFAALSPHATNPLMDAIATGADTITVAYLHTDNTVHGINYTVSTATASATFQYTDNAGNSMPHPIAGIGLTSLSWVQQFFATTPILLVSDGSTGTIGHRFGNGVTSNATVDTVFVVQNYRNCTGWTVNATDYNVLLDLNAGGSAYLNSVSGATLVSGVVTFTNAIFPRLQLNSRPWKGPDGEVYAVFNFDSVTQPMNFLLRIPSTFVSSPPISTIPVARMQTYTSNGKTERQGALSSLLSFGSGAIVPLISRVRLESAAGQQFFDTGVNLYKFGFNDTIGPAKEAAGSLFTGGGFLREYDGYSYFEPAFHLYPEGVAAPTFSVGGGLVPGNTYNWIVVFRYIDAQGRIIRSSPSAAIQATVPGGDGTASFASIPTARVTSMFGQSLQIELYRTTNGGTTFYRVASTSNSLSAQTVSMTDAVSDANLVSGELLYTTGGVLAAQPANAVFALEQFDQRLVGIDAEDRSLIRMTSQFVDGVAPVWNENLAVRINNNFGDANALAVMDDKLIIFFANAIYYINGVGPDATGSGNYNSPQLIAVGDGVAANQVQSVVTTSDGVYFISARGICILTRGLQVQYIGQPMQTYMQNFVCTGAALMPDVTRIRWFSAAGTTIVYDYVHNIWGIFTGQPTSTAVNWNGLPVVADATGTNLYIESPGTYLERGAQFAQIITLPWLVLAGLRGYQRFYKVQGIGACADAATPIGVTFTYDFDPTTAHQQNVTPSTLWDWEARPARQWATALKLSIKETAPAGQGFTMNGVSLLYGVQPGLLPIAKTKRAV